MQEIRNAIYLYLIPRGKTFKPKVEEKFRNDVALERGTHPWRIKPIDKTLALARTCKQMNDEVASFFYGSNTFSFKAAYDLYTYLYMIGYNRRRFITSIRVLLIYPDFDPKSVRLRPPIPNRMQESMRLAFDLLGECIFLQKLYLGIRTETLQVSHRKYCRLPDLQKAGIFSGIHGLKNLDLRVREVAVWSEDWGIAHQEEWWEGNRRVDHPAVHFDQFDLPLGYEFQKGLQKHFTTGRTCTVEDLRQFEIELAAGMQEVRQEPTTRVGQEDKVTKNQAPIQPLRRAEAILRRERESLQPPVQPNSVSVPGKAPKIRKPWRC